MNQPVATMEDYDAGTMGFFDEDGNYWEPDFVTNDKEIPNQSASDERNSIEVSASTSRSDLNSASNSSLPSANTSDLKFANQSQRRIGLLDSEQPQRRPLEPPLSSMQSNDGSPPKIQVSIPNPESYRTLLPPPSSSLKNVAQSSISSVGIGGDVRLGGSAQAVRRPVGALPRQGLLDGGDPSSRFSAESRERAPLLSEEQRDILTERRETVVHYDMIEGPPVFKRTFDLSFSLAIFDKAYENALWGYDPKFTWDYLPGTKRGTVEEPVTFTVNKDYLEEEFKWKKSAAVQEKHWREEFIPKVLEEKRLRDAGLVAERKPNQTTNEAICDFMLEKLDWKDDTCVVEYCSICDIEFQAVMPSVQHYESSAHDRAVKHFIVNEMRAYRQVTPEQLQTPWIEVMLNRIIKKIKVKPEIWYCNACNVPISSLLIAKQHLKGSGHRRKLSGLPPIQKLPFHLRNQYQDVCVLCSVTLTDEAAIEAHICSIQHIAAVQAAARSNIAVPPGPSGWIRDRHLPEDEELGALGGSGGGRRGGIGYGGGSRGRGGGNGVQFHPPPPALNGQKMTTFFSQGSTMRVVPTTAAQATFSGEYSSPYGTFFQPPPPPPSQPASHSERIGQIKNEYSCELCKKKFLDNAQMKLHLESFQHHVRATQATKPRTPGSTVSAPRGRGGGNRNTALFMPPSISEYDDPKLTVSGLGFVPGGPVKQHRQVY